MSYLFLDVDIKREGESARVTLKKRENREIRKYRV